MPTQLTIQDWLQPRHGGVTRETWAQMAQISEITVLHAAMECARRGDAPSLTALFQYFESAGASVLLAENRRMDLDLVAPDYGKWKSMGEDAAPQTKLPTQALSWEAVSFEEAVAVCLARRTGDGSVVMPRSEAQDRREDYVRPRGPLDEVERELLATVIKVYQKEDVTGLAAADGQLRLLFALAARVSAPDLVDFLVDQGFDPQHLCELRTIPRLQQQAITAAREALQHGNVAFAHAWRIASDKGAHVFTPQRADDQDLRSALRKPSDPKANSATGRLIEVMRGFRPEQEPGLDPRYGQLLEIIRLSHERQPPHVTLQASLRLAVQHIQASVLSRRSWREPILGDMNAALGADQLSRDELVEAARWHLKLDNGDLQQDFTELLRHQCAPMLRLLQPALPELLKAGALYSEPAQAFNRLREDTSWSAADGPRRFLECVDLLRDACEADPLGTFNHYSFSTSGKSRAEGATTLLHALARRPREGVLMAMVGLVERGADPQALDATQRTPAQCLENFAPHLLDAWRAVVARRAAHDVLQDVPRPTV